MRRSEDVESIARHAQRVDREGNPVSHDRWPRFCAVEFLSDTAEARRDRPHKNQATPSATGRTRAGDWLKLDGSGHALRLTGESLLALWVAYEWDAIVFVGPTTPC